MQAITIAIGKQGIADFCSQLVSNELTSALSSLAPPGNTISVPDFLSYGFGWSDNYSDISVVLSNGSLSNFVPVWQGVSQLDSGTPAGSQFLLTLTASNFTANYDWVESYYSYFCSSSGGPGGGGCSGQNGGNSGSPYSYGPQIGLLTVTVTASFVYQNTTPPTYQITVSSSGGTTSNVTPNIPGQSILQGQDSGCFSYHVSDMTASAISSIDFASVIANRIPSLLASIPASGDLSDAPGNVIAYQYQLGDSGMAFSLNGSNNDGITIGVSGDVTYNGTNYSTVYPKLSGQALPSLPIPAVPADADTHDMYLYVSNFEMDALHWAYYSAGLLATTVNASELPDPAALKCSTYYPAVAAFKFYTAYEMTAAVQPLSAPLIAFQEVWSFTTSALATLQTQLPSTVYTAVSNLSGDIYLSTASLESDLTQLGVAQSYYAAIEAATQTMAMIVTHSLQLTLTIQTTTAPQPNIVFTVSRQDCLQNLSFGTTVNGASKTIQTLGYAFTNVSNSATFVSSTVPNFDGPDFGSEIWPQVGEPNYDQLLNAMGKIGVALPIMEGFSFTMSNAVISVQQGYVSILTNVESIPAQTSAS